MAEIFTNETTALPRPSEGTLVCRTAQADWQDTGTEGFLIKPLFEDAGSGQRTWLMKVEPGALAPPHAHDETTHPCVPGGTRGGRHRPEASPDSRRVSTRKHGPKSDTFGTMTL